MPPGRLRSATRLRVAIQQDRTTEGPDTTRQADPGSYGSSTHLDCLTNSPYNTLGITLVPGTTVIGYITLVPGTTVIGCITLVPGTTVIHVITLVPGTTVIHVITLVPGTFVIAWATSGRMAAADRGSYGSDCSLFWAPRYLMFADVRSPLVCSGSPLSCT